MTEFCSRRLILLCSIFALSALTSCKKGGETGAEPVVQMGTTVALGGLKYTVFQSEWRENLEAQQQTRTPKHRFLLLHVAVENTSGEELGIPMFHLTNDQGETFNEESDGNGVPDWLGFLRVAKGGTTERGTVLFDVPQTTYRLRVSSGGDDPENEKTAQIVIPLRVDVEQPGVTPVVPGTSPQ